MTRRASGEGTVWRRKDGTWIAQTSMTQGRKWFSSRKSRALAIAKRDEWLRSHGATLASVKSSSTLREYLDAWLSSVQKSLAPRTSEGYRILLKHIPKEIGAISLTRIGPHHIAAAIDTLTKTPVTARKLRRALFSALDQAVKWDLIRANPVTKTKAPKAPKSEIRPLYPEELKIWLAHDHGKHRALIVLLTLAGPRLGEALGLEWRHVDFAGKRITFNQTLQRHTHALHIADTKTKSSRRTIHVGDRVIRAMRERKRQQAEERMRAGANWNPMPGHDLAFTSETGSPIDQSAAYKIIIQAFKDSGIEKRRPHDLRHTAATEQLRRGTPWAAVQKMLGHSTPTTTLAIYGHLVPGMLEGTARVMDEIGN